MPFASRLTDPRLIGELNAFAAANNFPDLYRAYAWRNDTYANGFPDIYCLESRLIRSDRTTGISVDDVKALAAWGAMPNQGRIRGPATIAPRNTLHNAAGGPAATLAAHPLTPLTAIQAQLHGVGPTYQSKVLRFGLPQEYGAIDTRCGRVFGHGDAGAHRHDWINLRTRKSGYRWYISSTQASWPDEYGMWIDILRYLAATLPSNCTHPAAFTQAGLRHQGRWECADVEMALFSYASNYT